MWTNFYGCVFKAQACLPLVGPRGAEDADRRLATSSSNGSARRVCLAACPLLLRNRLQKKNKELAAYVILWDTPMAPGYSHLHLTFVL